MWRVRRLFICPGRRGPGVNAAAAVGCLSVCSGPSHGPRAGIHNKPIVLLNMNGIWEPISAFVKVSIREGFTSPAMAELYSLAAEPKEVIEQLQAQFHALEA